MGDFEVDRKKKGRASRANGQSCMKTSHRTQTGGNQDSRGEKGMGLEGALCEADNRGAMGHDMLDGPRKSDRWYSGAILCEEQQDTAFSD